MRVLHAALGAFALIFVANQASGTLMLGSLLMALKGGLFASKMGIGGLLAMALAGKNTFLAIIFSALIH